MPGPTSRVPAGTSATKTPTPRADEPRWAQLTYASFDRADGSPGGWQEKDVAGNPDDAEMRDLRRHVVSQFGYHATVSKFPSVEQINGMPVRMSYEPGDGTKPGVLTYAVNAGVDSTGRPGNVFSHILIDRRPDTLRPIDLWKSPSFARPVSVDDILKTSIDPTPAVGPLGSVATTASVLRTPGYVEPILAAADALVHAQGKHTLVLVTDRQDWAAIIIMALQYLMSPSLARHMAFSLYERATALTGQLHVVAVPACDLEAVESNDYAYILRDGDVPRIESDAHIMAAGPAIPVTDFSRLIRALIADETNLGTHLEDLTGMDAWAEVAPAEDVSPAWALAGLIAHSPESFDSSVAPVAVACAAENPPASVSSNEVLFGHVVQAVVDKISHVDDPWQVVDDFGRAGQVPQQLIAQREALIDALKRGDYASDRVAYDPTLVSDTAVHEAARNALQKELDTGGHGGLALINLLSETGVVTAEGQNATNPVNARVEELVEHLPETAPNYSGSVYVSQRGVDVVVNALLASDASATPQTAVPPPPPTAPPAQSGCGQARAGNTDRFKPPAAPPKPTARPQDSRWSQRSDTPVVRPVTPAHRRAEVSRAFAQALCAWGLPTEVLKRAQKSQYSPLVLQLVAAQLTAYPQLAQSFFTEVTQVAPQVRPRAVMDAIVAMPPRLLAVCEKTKPGWLGSEAMIRTLNAYPYNDELRELCTVLTQYQTASSRSRYAKILLDAYAHRATGVTFETLEVFTLALGDFTRHHGHALSSYLYAFHLIHELPHLRDVRVADWSARIVPDSVDPTRVRTILEKAQPSLSPVDLVVLLVVDSAVPELLSPAGARVAGLRQGDRRVLEAIVAPAISRVTAEAVSEKLQTFLNNNDEPFKRSMTGEIKRTIKTLGKQEDQR